MKIMSKSQLECCGFLLRGGLITETRKGTAEAVGIKWQGEGGGQNQVKEQGGRGYPSAFVYIFRE